jgi:signal transduction histidine kinase
MLATPLPETVRAAVSAIRPAEDPFWFRLGGTAVLREGDRLATVPLADSLPGTAWALAAAGESWDFAALLLGQGPPPRDLTSDPLLTGALLRRVGEQVSAGRPGAQVAAEALARLSHEFKTPLVSIKGYAELLLDRSDEPVSPRGRDWLRRIAAGANRLASLFDKVTAEARTDAPWAYAPQPVAPEEWVRRCVAEVQELTGERDLRWTVQIAAGLGPVALDPDAGRNLLLELFQNAARATPDGGEVRISGRAEARAGAAGVRVTVADTGVGVPGGPAAEALFDRFASLGSAMEHHSGDFEFGAAGLGLGLALVRGIARAHGGEAWAEGRGRDPVGLPGAAFHIWLPHCQGSATRTAETPGSVPATGRERLLVLEPDPEPCRILEVALAGTYTVTCTHTPEEALRRWREGGWAGCVLEPRLLRGGGVNLIHALRGQPGAEAAVILTYSTGGAPEASAWRAAGADGCVAKPARARLLVQRLKTLSARRARC